jgi:multidrug resistance efflux pump
MRRRLPFLRLVLGLVGALLLTAAAALWLVKIDRVVVAQGRLAGGSIPVRSAVPGRILSVEAASGESVESGRPLVRLETDALEAEIERSTLRLDTLREQLRAQHEEWSRLGLEVHPREKERAAQAAERARLELSLAEVKAETIASLGAEGLASRLEVDEAELVRRLAAVTLQEAESAIPLLETRQKAELAAIAVNVSTLEGEIAGDSALLEELNRLLGDHTILAEADGVVVGNGLEELPGRQIVAGEELFRLAVAMAERFEGRMSDSGRAQARPGLAVKIRVEGYPWLIHGTLDGRVRNVSDRRDESGGFPVTISLDPDTAPGDLYEGMIGEARIVIEHKVSLGRILLERITEPGSS